MLSISSLTSKKKIYNPYNVIENLNIKVLLSFFTTLLTSLFGKEFLFYEVLFILVVIDTILGVIRAGKKKELSSSKAKGVVFKLILYYSLIIATHQITRIDSFLVSFEKFIVIFLAMTELLSIIENLNKLGVPIPSYITKRLQHYLKDKI